MTTQIGIGAQIYSNPIMAGGISIPPPEFFAPLKTSLIPQTGIGIYTFARAAASTILDSSGIAQACKTGEARFKYARRVENAVGDDASEDMTNGYYAPFSATVTDATHI